MVWGAFTSKSTLELQVTSTRMNSAEYIQVLENSLLPFLEGNREIPFVFQQDNARIHVSRETKRFLDACSIQTMNWPACSPDLNPIENVWGLLVRRVYVNNRQYNDINELKASIMNEWAKRDISYLKKLCNSMKKRLFCIGKANGASINY